MGIKCIAIGNRLLMDDGIGVRVGEELTAQLNFENIEVMVAETDAAYAFHYVESGDFLFVLDATYYNIIPGTVTITSLVDLSAKHPISYTQHQPSLIDMLLRYKEDISGYLIGIEIDTIDYGIGLSSVLNEKLSSICSEVYEIIKKVLKDK